MVGEDVSELLDLIAAKLKVIEIARIKKSCRRCKRMVQEPAPSRPIRRYGMTSATRIGKRRYPSPTDS